MTGPTTATELLDLAATQVRDLLRAADTGSVIPVELATAWPAFLRAAQHLTTTVGCHPPNGPRPAGGRPQPSATTDRPVRPEPHLQRAAELIAAAADLIASRDRRELLPAHLRADAAYAAPTLLAAAHQVAQATLPDPTLLPTAASASGAASVWSQALPSAELPTGRAASFDDASTLVSRPTPPPGDLAGLLNVAVHDWQHAARAAAERAAPSSSDLEGAAWTAGALLGLSQLLLQAHTATGPDTAGVVSQTVARLRAAGTHWNTAAGSWRTVSTGTPPSRELLEACGAVDTTITLLGRTADAWAPAQDVRGRAGRDTALASARGALAAVQAVADQHAALVTRLAKTGALYARARQLPPSVERLKARATNTWLPVGTADCAPLVRAYRRLPDATAASRLLYTTATATVERAAASVGQASLWPPPAARPDREDPAPTPPAPAAPSTLAGQRWHDICRELDPRLTGDPHYLALAAALDRIELAGVDVTATLADAATTGPLPDRHTARTLHYQLIEVCPAAVIPYTDVFTARAAPSRPSPSPPPPALDRPQPASVRSGPAR